MRQQQPNHVGGVLQHGNGHRQAEHRFLVHIGTTLDQQFGRLDIGRCAPPRRAVLLASPAPRCQRLHRGGGNCLEVSILGRVVERTAMRCCDDVVILRPGDHQKVTHQNRYFVRYDVALPSGDDNSHICLHPTEEEEDCFFAPADAM
ncbi:hypothetical protein [Mesorhizobium atlanticum]|uniref:hypothetical protein n=1 Tax=Mesorhizobium atlanticum TaxID=2233532 RepID=UPI0011BF4EBF|nr:hypothetical protein [Mesorhizobium atlanticum]